MSGQKVVLLIGSTIAGGRGAIYEEEVGTRVFDVRDSTVLSRSV